MKPFNYSVLITLPIILSGGMAVAENDVASNGTNQYPKEFIQQYSSECIETSMGEGLEESDAIKLCQCTIDKFQSKYDLERFKQLTIDSANNKQAEATLIEVGQICFEQILYEQ